VFDSSRRKGKPFRFVIGIGTFSPLVCPFRVAATATATHLGARDDGARFLPYS